LGRTVADAEEPMNLCVAESVVAVFGFASNPIIECCFSVGRASWMIDRCSELQLLHNLSLLFRFTFFYVCPLGNMSYG
jgi:hypothetical protein